MTLCQDPTQERLAPTCTTERFSIAASTLGLFVVVYFGANWLNAQRSGHIDLSMPWEHQIPLMEGFIIAYLSLFIVMFVPLFVLPVESLRLMRKRCVIILLISGVLFLAIPTTISFPDSGDVGNRSFFFQLVKLLDYPHNGFPSLHVSFSTMCALGLSSCLSRAWYPLIGIWLFLVVLSTLFVHQHYSADLVGGFVLALLVTSFVKR